MKTRIQLLSVCLLLLLSSFAVEAQKKWFNPMENQNAPYICNRGWNTEIGGKYLRMPERAKGLVTNSVWGLCSHTAGMAVRFFSNAPEIEVRLTVPYGRSMFHMPSTGVSGVDLYTMDSDGNIKWCASRFTPSFGDTIVYTYDNISYHNTHNFGNEYTLYLPLYNGVNHLEIGIPENADFYFIPETQEKPIAIYGTSITQGACASRPGMAWTNILQRRLEMPVINLGFSGSGQMEPEFFQFFSEIDARMFVIDCMPNMTDERVPLIQERVINGVHQLRKKSSAPILLMEHDGYQGFHSSDARKKQFTDSDIELKKAFEKLTKEGIKNLYYLTFEEIGLGMEAQVDGVHATDVGMTQYANAVEKKINEILSPEKENLKFKPCRQHRDTYTYPWWKRHEQILEYNKQNQPEIVMFGNSITHFWGGQPQTGKACNGKESWEKLFEGKNVVNMGYGWDRIENFNWRILHGEFDGFKAKKIFMMIGTNNININTDEEIAEGVAEVVDLIHKKQPQAELYVVKILPRRDNEKKVAGINKLIKKAVKNKPNVEVLDFTNLLIGKDKKIDEHLFIDGLHPNNEGYSRIADKMKAYIE